jgi:hypothetical protein
VMVPTVPRSTSITGTTPGQPTIVIKSPPTIP